MPDMKDTYNQIGRASMIIIALSLVDKALALVKEMLVARNFGIAPSLDVFNVAYALPAVTVLFFTGALSSAFIPLYLEWTSRRSREHADANARLLIYSCCLFFGALALAGYLLSPFLFALVGYGFGAEEKRLGIELERILIFLLLIDGAGMVLRGLLHAGKSFFSLYIAPIFVNLVLILFLSSHYGSDIHTMAWGFIAGTLCKVIYMAVALHRGGFSFFSKPNLDWVTLTSVVAVALPMLGSEMIANSNLLVDQVMASQLSPGSVSALRYAYRINDMPIQVIVMAISRAIFPFLAEQAISGSFEPMRVLFKQALVFLGFLTAPIICLMVLFSRDIVALLLQRGAFDAQATKETADTLVLYSTGMFFYAYTFINGTFFSALKDTKPLFYVGCASIILNFTFNYLFMHAFGVKGIALSTTVTLGTVSIVSVFLLRRRLALTAMSAVYFSLWRIAASGLLMYVSGLLLLNGATLLGIHRLIYLPLLSLALFLLYLTVIRILRTEQLDACLSLTMKPISIVHAWVTSTGFKHR